MAFGVLATVNGVGDFLSSVIVGPAAVLWLVWANSPWAEKLFRALEVYVHHRLRGFRAIKVYPALARGDFFVVVWKSDANCLSVNLLRRVKRRFRSRAPLVAWSCPRSSTSRRTPAGQVRRVGEYRWLLT